MPSFLDKSSSQLSTIDANSSRFITKCRWVVEVVNSFLKKSFKALREVRNISLPHTIHDYRIAGALINRFFMRLFSDIDDQQTIIDNMKSKLKKKTTSRI